VTAPLFFLDHGSLADAAAGSIVVLAGAEGRHAATVRRIGAGESVLLADGSGRRATAVVQRVDRAELQLVVESVEQVPAPQPRFVLVQALAKGDRDEQAIEAATELGVDEVVPWQAGRSIVVWRGERAAKAHRKWGSVVLAAAKQSRRATVPVVAPVAHRRGVTELVRQASLALVLHEDASTALATVALPPDGDVLLVVGPEGGIAPDELEAFTAAGARAVRLGDTVLRSSSAGPAALAVLSAAGRWR
jgi:16S rRNA (uracil1498-N3)-methyltransferase